MSLNKYKKKIEAGEKDLTDLISNYDFYKYFSNKLPIVSSSELPNYTIEQLVDNEFNASVILIENPITNHWVLINKIGNTIEYFDSYAVPLEKSEIKFYKEAIVPKYKLVSNKVQYQKLQPNINTCGKHCSMRLLALLQWGFPLNKYKKFMKELSKAFKEDYDNIVSVFVTLD